MRVPFAKGWPTGVFSGWSAGWDRTGSFVAGGGTNPKPTSRSSRRSNAEIVKMTEGEVTDCRTRRRRDAILKSFTFEFDSKGKIVGRLMSFESRLSQGLAPALPGRHCQSHQRVMSPAANKTAPRQFAILVLGKEKDFEKPSIHWAKSPRGHHHPARQGNIKLPWLY